MNFGILNLVHNPMGNYTVQSFILKWALATTRNNGNLNSPYFYLTYIHMVNCYLIKFPYKAISFSFSEICSPTITLKIIAVRKQLKSYWALPIFSIASMTKVVLQHRFIKKNHELRKNKALMLQRALGTLILIIHSHQSLLRHVLVKKYIWVIFYYAM